MEQMTSLGREFHNKRVQTLSVGRKAVGKPKPPVTQGYQAFGANPAEFDRKRAPGYKPPNDDYKYKGPSRIGGVPLSTHNMKDQIVALTKVGHFHPGKRPAAEREHQFG